MWTLRQQFKFSPVQKFMQGCEWVLGNCTLIGITPHLQSHQSYTNVQYSVKLREHIISNSQFFHELGPLHLLTKKFINPSIYLFGHQSTYNLKILIFLSKGGSFKSSSFTSTVLHSSLTIRPLFQTSNQGFLFIWVKNGI